MLDSHPRRPAPRNSARRFIRCAVLGLLTLAVLPAAASAEPNDSFEGAQRINQPGTPLGTSFVTTDNNVDDEFVNTGEPDQCSAGSTINFGSSVYFEIHPHRNGRVVIVVDSLTTGFKPVAHMPSFTLGTLNYVNGPCNGAQPPINKVTLPSSGYIPVTAGQHYKIQIGGETIGNTPGGTPTEGNFQLQFTYDPNTDGDALFDSQDRCDTQAGPTNFQGCPDSDGDNISNPDDRCPTKRGPANFRGCPDTDRDKIPDIDDKCPRDSSSSRDPNKDGCLDLHRLVDAKLNHTFYSNGIVVTSLEIVHVPRRSRVSLKCRRPSGRRNCGSKLIKRATAASPQARFARTVKGLRGKRLPYGSTITIRVTKRGATGKYIRYKVVHGTKRFKRVDRCTNHGSKKLRKRRCK